MSYDLYLFRETDGDPEAAFELLEEEDEEREPTAEEEAELRRLAADLQAASPGLDLTEAARGFLLQLGYETQRPVVLDIGAGSITMSWSYGADAARPAIDEVRTYLPVFERHGYVAYDPAARACLRPRSGRGGGGGDARVRPWAAGRGVPARAGRVGALMEAALQVGSRARRPTTCG
jgi:hypothetical protein